MFPWLSAFVKEWNEHAHPFHWSKESVAKIMAKCEIIKCETLRAIAA
jgi:hypothetical protein